MELFYEQNVENPNIDKHRKRTAFLSVFRKVLLAIGIILIFVLGGNVKVNNGSVSIILGFAISIVSGVPFILTFIFLGKFLNNTNSEYDYILNGSVLRIVRVIRRNKRKLMATVRMDTIESIGKVSAETYDRYASVKNIKKKYALCEYENEDAIVYVRYREDGEDFLLHITPNEEMIASIRKSLPRISIMDKSMTVINPVKKDK